LHCFAPIPGKALLVSRLHQCRRHGRFPDRGGWSFEPGERV